jgi:hypothetical protein
VSFELESRGAEVKLTVTHRRLPNRAGLVSVASGWHVHLDILEARARGRELPPFWETWLRLKAEYEPRIPQ